MKESEAGIFLCDGRSESANLFVCMDVVRLLQDKRIKKKMAWIFMSGV